jgi:hypothetical protein
MKIALLLLTLAWNAAAQTPDLILIHGKILTVDANDSIVEAVAIAKAKLSPWDPPRRSSGAPGQPRASSIFTALRQLPA